MKRLLYIGWLIAVWIVAGPAIADTLHGRIIVVIDGDTVLFKPDHQSVRSRAFLKIRLADIDAPEKDQPYGALATLALSELVLKQTVEINTLATDAYGRIIAQLQYGPMQINTELVRLGVAWVQPRYRRNGALLDAQEEARAARRGLWADTAPTSPWVWRRAQKASVNGAKQIGK